MPLEPDLLAMLTMSASVQHRTGTDTVGNETYGTATTEKCFLTVQKTRLGQPTDVRFEGLQVVESEVIFDAIGLHPKDRFVLDGKTYYINDVDTPKNELGVDLMHTVSAITVKD